VAAAAAGEGGGEEDGKTWTLAGTVYGTRNAASNQGIQDARIYVRDANGKSFTLRSNQVGNFYTAESLQFPLTVAVGKGLNTPATPMQGNVNEGGCNGCHGSGERITP
jgi:hypothetical protein